MPTLCRMWSVRVQHQLLLVVLCESLHATQTLRDLLAEFRTPLRHHG